MPNTIVGATNGANSSEYWLTKWTAVAMPVLTALIGLVSALGILPEESAKAILENFDMLVIANVVGVSGMIANYAHGRSSIKKGIVQGGGGDQ